MQPLYSSVEEAKSGSQSELRGAVLNVQATPGVTAEWLDRALECHSAKRVLGQTQQAAGTEDPEREVTAEFRIMASGPLGL